MSQQCLQRTVPSYIDPTLAQQRVDNYLQHKRPVLTEWAGKEETTGLTIPTQLFAELVDALKKDRDGKTVSGVRTYFASYIADSTAADVYIPKGQEKLLTLIFVPTYQPGSDENEQVNFKDYYIIDYNTGSIANLNTSTDDINKFSWVTLYQTQEIPVLQAASVDPPVSETQKMWFAITDFIDWADEVACNTAQGTLVSNIYFAFSAYGTDDTFTFKVGGKDVTVSIANQLSLVISIYPDDASVQTAARSADTSGSGGGTDYNNGTPCPPAKC